jgi:hypothetical protein
MIPLPIEQISRRDLEGLIGNQVHEGKSLEFKRELPGRDSAARHELLADVSALANLSGGDIIFGIEENGEGLAANLLELACNPDDECLRIQDIIANGLEPKVSGIHVHPVSVGKDTYNFVLRVPQSWNAPHRVKTNQHFYIREGRRKRQLDIPEIRTAFIRSDTPSVQIQNFRSGRLGKILGGVTPVPLFDGAIEVLHIVLMEKYFSGVDIDVLQYTGARQLPVLSVAGGFWRLNIDGVLHSRDVTPKGCGAYTQLFRNGMIEAVRVFTTPSQITAGRFSIPSQAYEVELIRFFLDITPELDFLGTTGPLLLLWSLIHADKAELGIDRNQRLDLANHQGPFDRQVLVLPDTLITDTKISPVTSLRPMFDMVWNSAGITRSMNYDANGNWVNR